MATYKNWNFHEKNITELVDNRRGLSDFLNVLIQVATRSSKFTTEILHNFRQKKLTLYRAGVKCEYEFLNYSTDNQTNKSVLHRDRR